MLRFDLAEVIRTPGMREVLEINEPPFTDDDVEYVAPIVGRVTATNTETLLLVRGRIKTVIGLECSRCLEPVREPIDTEIDLEFDLKDVDGSGHHDKDVHVVEDELVSVFEGKILRMDRVIREAALLAAPLQPLCRTDCPGIKIRGAKAGSDDGLGPMKKLSDLSSLLDD